MGVRPCSRSPRVVGCVMGSSCEFWCKERRACESMVFVSFNPSPPQLGLLTGEIHCLWSRAQGWRRFCASLSKHCLGRIICWKHQLSLLSRLREMVRMCQKSPLVWIALQSAVSCAVTQGLGRLTAGWSKPFGNVTVNMGLR